MSRMEERLQALGANSVDVSEKINAKLPIKGDGPKVGRIALEDTRILTAPGF